MKLIQSLIVLSMVAASPMQNASAGEFLQLNPYSAHIDGAASLSAGFGPNAGLSLPDGLTSSFAMGFVLPLPPEYTTGQRIRLGLAWHTDATTPCDASLRPNFLSVARFGQSHIVDGGIVSDPASGLSPEDGTTTLTAGAKNVTYLEVYEITPPDGTTALAPADVINFGLYRPADVLEDTCAGHLVIQGAAILLGD